MSRDVSKVDVFYINLVNLPFSIYCICFIWKIHIQDNRKESSSSHHISKRTTPQLSNALWVNVIYRSVNMTRDTHDGLVLYLHVANMEMPLSVNAVAFIVAWLWLLTEDRTQGFICMPKSLHALITGLPSITWKIHHSTSTDLAHK